MLLLCLSLWSDSYIIGNPFVIEDIEQGFILPSLIYKYGNCVFIETGKIENYGFNMVLPGSFGALGFRFTKGIFYNWNEKDPFLEIIYGQELFGLGLFYSNFREETPSNTLLERKLYGGIVSFNILDFSIGIKAYKMEYIDQTIWSIERSKNSYSYDANIIYSKDLIKPFLHLSHNDFSYEEANVNDTNFVEENVDSTLLGLGLKLGINEYVNLNLIPALKFYSKKVENISLTKRSICFNSGFDIKVKFIKLLFGLNGNMNQVLDKQDTITATNYNQSIDYKTGIYFIVKDFDFGFILDKNLLSQGPYFITGTPIDPVIEFKVNWRFKD